MAYVRRRTTSSGAISTSLVESYRDEKRRPRQRVLANLHGMPDLLGALAKMATHRERLRKERERIAPEIEQANRIYEAVTTNTLAGHRYSPEQRKEIDQLLKARKRLLKHAEAVNATLATIQKDGAVIRKHCTAAESEIQEAIRAYKKEMEDADALAAFDELSKAKRQSEKQRLSMGPSTTALNRTFIKEMAKNM